MTTPESESPRVAAVTGGSRGIGRAVVEALLADGWRVYFSSLSAASVDTAARALGAEHGTRVHGQAIDVRDARAVSSWIDALAESEGRIDCLVNNAGVGGFGPVDEISEQEWRRVLDTNLYGAFWALRAAARQMKVRGGGWILNIGSLASRNPFAGGSAYNASKFGLLGLSEAAMLDLRQHGIRVCAVLPGSVDTEFGLSGDGSWKLAPEDVARAVTDLLRYPERALPSRIELRPSRPPKG
jgi:NAD(P)-dependent dehydrogenase (short-subunit alcohol dehydrogenase family)